MNTLVARPGIAEIDPYVGGESAIKGRDRVVKLASNEGALGPSPKAVAAYVEAAQSMHRYPDGACVALRSALAERYGLDRDRIVCGAGSDELLSLLCRAYAGPSDEVLYSEHGFLIFPIAARAVGATPVTAPEAKRTVDVDAVLARVSEKTRVVFIANPNNPTGTYLSAAEMRRLKDGLSDSVLLVVDAAYAEYVERDDYEPGIELVDSAATVVMTRTFSKIHALGGLRLGWCYAPPAVVDVLNRIRLPFNVSRAAQAAGLAALADVAFTEGSLRHNTKWRAWLTERLRGLGLIVGDSVCNFVIVQFPATPDRDAAAADAFLKARGLIARRLGGYGLPGCLRITIGRAEEMGAVADALTEFVG
ncbi:MAG TPA: histidinol-phosphate transaminase [Rhodospirillales bacterium]|nr:histidinol-phosphate transaminase [Rhodospirillales bacterium]